MIATVLQIVGAAFVVLAAALVSPALGVLVLGVACLLFGIVREL